MSATACPIDIDAAIVRFVGTNQPARFDAIAELFAEPPAHGVVNATTLKALHTRLERLCQAGRIQRLSNTRYRNAAQRAMNRACYGAPHPQPLKGLTYAQP